MKRGWISFLLVVGLLTAAIPAAFAADSADVAEVIAETGVYVEAGTTASEDRVGELVSALRSEGENLSMVVLAEEPVGGATTFADAVFNRLGQGLIVVVAPESVGYSGISEFYGDVEIDEALEVGLDGDSDGEVLELFTAALLGEQVEGAPVIGTPEPVSAPNGGDSGGSGLLIFLIIAGVGVVGFLWWRSQRNQGGGALHPQLAEAKEAVQQQINNVANDLIDMEDEVRAADNEQVDEFYDGAGAIYNDVTEKFATADTPHAILDLSNDLDQAIWQLDSAEAVLDGKPLPARPAPKQLPTPESSAPSPTSAPQGTSSIPPRPRYDEPAYDRRATRRSQPLGPGLMDILMGVAGAMMASRSRSSAPSGGGGLFGGLGGLGTTSSTRRVPPPQFPSVPSRTSSSSTPSPRRGRTGRMRGGGKRRR